MAELLLNNALVSKHFGATPNKGRRIKGHTIRSSCGVRIKQNWGRGTEFVPQEVTVDMVIALHWVKGNNQEGLWRVTASQGYEEIAIEWLLEHCQIKLEKRPRARSIKQRRPALARWGRSPDKVDNG